MGILHVDSVLNSKEGPMNRRVFCVILVLAVLVVAVPAVAAEKPPIFVRVGTSRSYVFVYFKGSEMRVAASFKGLKEAEPIQAAAVNKSSSGQRISFAEVDLPFPENKLPFKATKLKAAFYYYDSNSGVGASLGLCIEDKEGVEWTFQWRGSAKGSTNPKKAPLIGIPDLRKLTLSVVTAPKGKKVGVGLRFLAGEQSISGIMKGSELVDVVVKIINKNGEVVVSDSGSIGKYGFG